MSLAETVKTAADLDVLAADRRTPGSAVAVVLDLVADSLPRDTIGATAVPGHASPNPFFLPNGHQVGARLASDSGDGRGSALPELDEPMAVEPSSPFTQAKVE